MKFFKMEKTMLEENGTITYTALPYPLPEVWQEEFRKAAHDLELLNAIEIQCRAAIGVQVTRPCFLLRRGRK